LVDRQEEIATCVRTVQNRERLFLIGPRRYGKTSILKAASEILHGQGAIVFRYSVEAYRTIEMLVSRLVADATEKLAGGREKASEKVRKFFGRLRPEATFNLTETSWSATLGVSSGTPHEQTHLLVDGLAGVERLAAEASAPVAIVLDEFQHLINLGGGGPSARRASHSPVLQLRRLGLRTATVMLRLRSSTSCGTTSCPWHDGSQGC
jgi:AAA+ ATPase superfamily predicted ATPase